MRGRIEATAATATLPAGVHVGDELTLTGVAVVVGIEDDLVDITPMGGDPEYVMGERTYRLLLRALEVERREPDSEAPRAET